MPSSAGGAPEGWDGADSGPGLTCTCSISASSPVCATSTGNTASVSVSGGQTPYTYAWSITGGTITSASNTASIVYTAGSGSSVVLSVTVTEKNGYQTSCSKTITVGRTTVTAQSSGQCVKTFRYNVCQTGWALSHWVLRLPTCFTASDIVSVKIDGTTWTHWSVGTDGDCGVYGLKWDDLDLLNPDLVDRCAVFEVTFDTEYQTGSVGWTGKYGFCGCKSGTTFGPSCEPCCVAPTCGISGDATACAGDEKNYVYSGNPGTGVDTYTWTYSGGTLVSGGGTTDNWIKIKWNTTGWVKLVVANACGTSTQCEKVVTVSNKPTCSISESGLAIVAVSQACVGDNKTYNFGGTGATSLLWSVTGGTIVGSNTGNSVVVNWTTAGTGRVTVVATNACGDTTCYLDVDVEKAPVCTIEGPTLGCVGATSTFKSTGTNVTGWDWDVTGGTFTGDGTDTIVVTWTSAGTKAVSLTVTNRCGTSTCSKSVSVEKDPVCTIDGPAVACEGATSTFKSAGTNVTGWTWTVTGGTFTGQGTDTIVVTWTTSGSGKVELKAANRCGDSTCEKSVTVGKAPVCAISGPALGCVGGTGTYESTGTNVTGWTWTVTGGTFTGQGTDTIVVTWATSGTGTVSLKVTNRCGEDTCNKSVSVETDPVCTIDGPLLGCVGATSTIKSTGANVTGWTWTVVGGTFTGQGTDTIVVTWTTRGTGVVTLVAKNRCGEETCSVQVDVEDKPTCAFTGPVEAAIGEHTTYTYTGLYGTGFKWTCVGGTIVGADNASSVEIVWTTPGAASVTLIASNRCGEVTCKQDVTLLCAIGDYVWLDYGPLNGAQDGAELPFTGGVKVELYDGQGNLKGTMNTNASGYYKFTRLQPGEYYLVFYRPTGYAFTLKDSAGDPVDSDVDRVTGQTVVTVLTPGEEDMTWDGGLFRIIGGGLGGYKFWDQNVSASWEMAVEPRIPGVKIVVKNASGQVVYQTTTQNAPGNTLLHGLWEWPAAPALLPGEYTIEEVVPTDWMRTYPETNGGVYRIRSYADGTFDLLSQRPAHFTGSLDFGNARPMGYKFLDENKNARRDSGEGLLGNWRITLQDVVNP